MERRTKKRMVIAAVATTIAITTGGICFMLTRQRPKSMHVHHYEEKDFPATCTEGGYTLHTCTCGESYRDNETNLLAHQYNEWVEVLAATVESEGSHERICALCGDKEVKAIPKLEEHKHTYEEKTVETTCTQDGYRLLTCTVCGYEEKKNVKTAPGHSWTSWTTTKEATTDSAGSKTRTCKTCGKVDSASVPKLASESTPPNNTPDTPSACSHLYGNWTIAVWPTASTEGTKQAICTRCGNVLSETIPKLSEEDVNLYENYIDSQIEIERYGNGATSYRYGAVAVVDTRTWGDPPTVRIASNAGFQISYFKADGSQVNVSLPPIEGYINQCAILEDGSYAIQLWGDFKD